MREVRDGVLKDLGDDLGRQHSEISVMDELCARPAVVESEPVLRLDSVELRCEFRDLSEKRHVFVPLVFGKLEECLPHLSDDLCLLAGRKTAGAGSCVKPL